MAGKPKSEIDIAQLEKLAALHCTIEEAAAFFKCAKRTLLRYLEKEDYRAAWERGQATGKLSLRRLQWRHANGAGAPAVSMTIHLSKHWLGETEKSLLELSGKDGKPIDVTTSAAAKGDLAQHSTADLKAMVAQLSEAAARLDPEKRGSIH